MNNLQIQIKQTQVAQIQFIETKQNSRRLISLAVSLLVAFIFLLAFNPAPLRAQNTTDARTVKTSAKSKDKRNKNAPNYGRIELTTDSGEYPLMIDGAANGTTSPTTRNLDLEPGSRTVEIMFPNGTRYLNTFNVVAGRKLCVRLNYRPRTIPVEPCLAASPCPYNVAVNAPATVSEGDLITFSADASYNGTNKLNYMWTVSPSSARITSGANSPTITVDTAGLANNRVTAILVVDDGSGDRNCRQTAQATTAILGLTPQPTIAKRFDEFPSIAFDDDKARLDNLAIELNNQPTARGYIVLHPSTRATSRSIQRLTTRTRNYLVNTRGIDASRITVINGAPRERDYFELYIVPQGAEPPR